MREHNRFRSALTSFSSLVAIFSLSYQNQFLVGVAATSDASNLVWSPIRRSITSSAFAPPLVPRQQRRQPASEQDTSPRGLRLFRRISDNRIVAGGNVPINPRYDASHLFLSPNAVGPDDVATFMTVAPTAGLHPSLILADSIDAGMADLTVPAVMMQESAQALSPTTTIFVFIVGVIPFIWATNEFWRRIAFGEPFGTGSDSVFIPKPGDEDNGLISIGEDGDPMSSRGRQTLDRSSLLVAYVLFAVAAFSVGIAIISVVASPPPPEFTSGSNI